MAVSTGTAGRLVGSLDELITSRTGGVSVVVVTDVCRFCFVFLRCWQWRCACTLLFLCDSCGQWRVKSTANLRGDFQVLGTEEETIAHHDINQKSYLTCSVKLQFSGYVAERNRANLPNRYSALCWRPVTHAQTWASYSELYRFGRLSRNSPTEKT